MLEKIQMLKKISIGILVIIAIWFSLNIKGCASSNALVIFDRVYSFNINYSNREIQKPAKAGYRPIEEILADTLTKGEK